MKYWTLLLSFAFFTGPLFAQLETGLVSRYYFNDGTAKDNFGPNDGINVDAIPVKDRFDNPRSALFFDGNGYVDLGDEPFRMGFDDFSLSFWMKRDQFTYRGYPLVKRIKDEETGKPISWGIKFGEDGNDLEVQAAYDDLTQDPSALAVIPDLEWHHYVIVYERTDKLKLYIDKYLVDEVDIKPSFFKTMDVVGASLFLGRDQEETEYFVGTLDDLRIYKRVLNPGDVESLFDEEYIPVSTSELEQVELGTFIYPNPVTTTINIQNPVSVGVQYVIFDPLQRAVARGDLPGKGNAVITLDSWPSGLYTVVLKDWQGGTNQSRFVKVQD